MHAVILVSSVIQHASHLNGEYSTECDNERTTSRLRPTKELILAGMFSVIILSVQPLTTHYKVTFASYYVSNALTGRTIHLYSVLGKIAKKIT